MSRVLAKPWMMLKPVTLAVIEPRVDAARAVVERCPMETTEAMTREYSSKCVLERSGKYRKGCSNALAMSNDW